MFFKDNYDTVDRKKNPRIYDYNSLPQHRRDTRIGGNSSDKSPGAPSTLQDPCEKHKAYVFKSYMFAKEDENLFMFLVNPIKRALLRRDLLPPTVSYLQETALIPTERPWNLSPGAIPTC